MVRMFMAPMPTPHTNGAPGLTAWLSTRPASTSALATTITEAMLAGAVVPAFGDGAQISGTSSSAQAMTLLAPSSSKSSGGTDIA
jgi:hypothetical protein